MRAHTECVRTELDRSRALWECIGTPNYSFEFTMLYDWPKAEPPDMELAKTFDAMFDRFKILGFSTTLWAIPPRWSNATTGSPRSTM